MRVLIQTELSELDRPTDDEHAFEVAVYWGNTILDEVQVAAQRAITVGPQHVNRSFDLRVDAELPFDDGIVAQVEVKSATIYVPREAQGFLKQQESAEQSLVPGSVKLSLHDQVVFQCGPLTFRARFVRGHARFAAVAPIDWYFPRIFSFAFIFHVFLVAAFLITPEPQKNMLDELLTSDTRYAEMILTPKKQEKKKTQQIDLTGAGARRKEKEGKVGQKVPPKRDAQASKKGAEQIDRRKRERDRKIAMRSGLLGMLKGRETAVSNVLGPGGLGTGINNAMGGLRGTEMGNAGGAGGLGTRGTQEGGGGGSLGIGGLGTRGRGKGGYGKIDLGGRAKKRTRILPGRTQVKGSLSSEDIARVIRRNLARFKYCYEKQLNTKPELAGKVSINFTIAPTGTVPKARIHETTIDDNGVEDCTIRVMKSLKFPRPKGGGIVVVTYPFFFEAS